MAAYKYSPKSPSPRGRRDSAVRGQRERGKAAPLATLNSKRVAPHSPEQEAALKAIALFLEKNGDLWPQSNDWLFLRAHYHPELFSETTPAALAQFYFSSGGGITCEQSSARAYRRLGQYLLNPKDRLHRQTAHCLLFAGYGPQYVPPVGICQPWAPHDQPQPAYDMALILGTSSRQENYVNFKRALESVRPGGWMVFSIANSLGANSFERQMAQVLPLGAQMSKFHCRTFAVQVPAEATPKLRQALNEWGQSYPYRLSPASGLLTRPGIFSWNKLDGGSALLGQYLRDKAELKGVGADFGSANGYLSKVVLESASAQKGEINRLDLFEDEYLALAAAKELLKPMAPKGLRLGFNWADVLVDVPREQYDWIIMNPPFHQGQTRVLNLGQEFVASASRSLTWRGTLYAVVNRTLPYEETLVQYFSSYQKVAENNSFKVLVATKPLAQQGC